MTEIEIRSLQMKRGWLVKKRRWREANMLLKRLQKVIRAELCRK